MFTKYLHALVDKFIPLAFALVLSTSAFASLVKLFILKIRAKFSRDCMSLREKSILFGMLLAEIIILVLDSNNLLKV